MEQQTLNICVNLIRRSQDSLSPEPPTPPPSKEEKPVEKSDSSKQTHDLLSKYIQNQDTINQSFNNAIMDLKDTMIKMEKKKQQRKKREVKKSLEGKEKATT